MGNISGLQQIGLGFAGIGAANSAVAGFGQYESGQEQKAAYDYNANVALQETAEKEETTEAKYAQLIGKQASDYAAAGVDIASGSPLLIMAHTAAQKAIEEESENQAGTEQAAIDRYEGKVSAFSGTIGGVSTFLSGLTKAGTQAATIFGPGGSG